jgi:signal transduction histidine kinase
MEKKTAGTDMLHIAELTAELQRQKTVIERLEEEVKVEAALERVRVRTMAMHDADELSDTSSVFFEEISKLGIKPRSCGFLIMHENSQLIEDWSSNTDAQGNAVIISGSFSFNQHALIAEVVAAWRRQDPYFVGELHGEDLQKYYQAITSTLTTSTEIKEKVLATATSEYTNSFYFGYGMMYALTPVPLQSNERDILLRFAGILKLTYRRFLDIQRAEEQTKEAQIAKVQIEKTLVDLRQAQSQLVQAEKMASLGELTAGIAHEIQNPLNFVNNFSEINRELISEMEEELQKGNGGEAVEIAKQIYENEIKILHHGKRADAIVKGMLLHSQSGTGKKEPTDINALANEYLNLAYHGLRAKDKSFNAAMKTEFDPTIGLIPLVPQDIGRVLLNLYNNAFYAVFEKKKSAAKEYKPTVSVVTRKTNGKLEIAVRDNGNGIPQKIWDKIFQPFFTTKPTGQGTGLGLSLSYDIVKSHGGEIKLDTQEGNFTEFLIQIPAT